jgi:hypothetical protein
MIEIAMVGKVFILPSFFPSRSNGLVSQLKLRKIRTKNEVQAHRLVHSTLSFGRLANRQTSYLRWRILGLVRHRLIKRARWRCGCLLLFLNRETGRDSGVQKRHPSGFNQVIARPPCVCRFATPRHRRRGIRWHVYPGVQAPAEPRPLFTYPATSGCIERGCAGCF